MLYLENEIEELELIFKQWFSRNAFIKASRIQAFPLFSEEKNLINGAVINRQQEFSTGRWLARQGLQQLGQPAVPIKIGRLRNPLWPESIIGSITHDANCCAVVVMQKQKHSELGVGIDLVALPQHSGKLDGLESMISKDVQEMDAVNKLNLALEPALLLFSIKESVIKALSFFLDDFIDMRIIEISYVNKIVFKLPGCFIKADVYATKSQNSLLTAVKVYQVDA